MLNYNNFEVNHMTVNINNDIPEPFRNFLHANPGPGSNPASESGHQEQEISAASINPENSGTRGRTDMQDFLFLAAILMLCDD